MGILNLFKEEPIKETNKEKFERLFKQAIRDKNYTVTVTQEKKETEYSSINISVFTFHILWIEFITKEEHDRFYSDFYFIYKQKYYSLKIDNYYTIDYDIENIFKEYMDMSDEVIEMKKEEEKNREIKEMIKEESKYKKLLQKALNQAPLDKDLQKAFNKTQEILELWKQAEKIQRKILRLRG